MATRLRLDMQVSDLRSVGDSTSLRFARWLSQCVRAWSFFWVKESSPQDQVSRHPRGRHSHRTAAQVAVCLPRTAAAAGGCCHECCRLPTCGVANTSSLAYTAPRDAAWHQALPARRSVAVMAAKTACTKTWQAAQHGRASLHLQGLGTRPGPGDNSAAPHRAAAAARRHGLESSWQTWWCWGGWHCCVRWHDETPTTVSNTLPAAAAAVSVV